MLIPSIDLKDGAVVQLVQGERLAIRDDDVFRWVRRFERFPKVQVIDLDAAMGTGDNLAHRPADRRLAVVPRRRRHPHRRARAATCSPPARRQIIAGSALFKDGRPDLEFARRSPTPSAPSGSSPPSTAAAARSSSTAGRRRCRSRAVEAVRALEPYLRRVPLHPRRHRRADAAAPNLERFSRCGARRPAA